MGNRIAIVLLLLFAVAASPPARAQGLPDGPHRKAAVKCQKVLLSTAVQFFGKGLAALGNCSRNALDCTLDPKRSASAQCSADNRCIKALEKELRTSDTDLEKRIHKACDSLTPEQLLAENGLGYQSVGPECLAIGLPVTDVGSLHRCLSTLYRRSLERLFAIEAPRAHELFELTGIDTRQLPGLSEYRSCDGCSVVPAAKPAAAIAKCSKTITSAGLSYAAKAAEVLGKCAVAFFECEQSPKPLSPSDAVRCRDAASKRCSQARQKAVDAEEKVRSSIATTCDVAAASFELLKHPGGANLGALAADCNNAEANATNVDLDAPTTLEKYFGCSRLQHGCRARQLVGFAVPRLDGLLNAPEAAALGDTVCSMPSDAQASTQRSFLRSCRICRFIRRMRVRFGPITKSASLNHGNAHARRVALAQARAAHGAEPAITSVVGEPTYDPSQTRQITVGYDLGDQSLAASRVPPPRMLIQLERLDGTRVDDDWFEVELEPSNVPAEFLIDYAPPAQGENGSSFRLLFGIANGDDTTYVPFDVVPTSSCGFPASGQKDPRNADKNDGIPGLVPVPDDGRIRAGAALDFLTDVDGTITDLNTGLMWEKKDDHDGLHDQDNTYAWSGDGSAMTIWDWLDQINAETGFGNPGFAGHNDWRIPNVKELQSLVDYEPRKSPSVDPAFDMSCQPGCTVLDCSCTGASSTFWTSTTERSPLANALVVQFSFGDVTSDAKEKAFSVRGVRTVQDCKFPATGQTDSFPANKLNDGDPDPVTVPDDGNLRAGAALLFVDNGDGTITDRNTNLTWEKKSDDGGLHDKDDQYVWSGNGAEDTIWDWLDDLNREQLGGHDDWRIPNIKELESLQAWQGSDPLTIDPVFRSSCQPSCTVELCSCSAATAWSSTSASSADENARYLDFRKANAKETTGSAKRTEHQFVRAVRGGIVL